MMSNTTNQIKSPAIVVVAFNRPKSLARILSTIANADYKGYENIPLVISIDKSNQTEVGEIARQFDWKYGSKQVIEHEKNLGLRRHIISCGDLTEHYESVIVLEDDLVVAPAFYDYAVQAMQFYGHSDDVSGISLYSYDFNEYAEIGFMPIQDGYDNYFMQSACSWGQLWTRKQWHSFKQWYEKNVDSSWDLAELLPNKVMNWPSSSWKKHFIRYMVLEQKYFVYPRISLTTNFSTPGTNHRGTSNNFQVSLLLNRKPFSFSNLEESVCLYDSHYEIEPHCLKLLNPNLKSIDFACDFYGTKNLEYISNKYLLSVRDCRNPELSYSLSFAPQELNIIFNLEGDFFNLGQVSNFGRVSSQKRIAQLKLLNKNLGWKSYSAFLKQSFTEKLSKKLGFK